MQLRDGQPFGQPSEVHTRITHGRAGVCSGRRLVVRFVHSLGANAVESVIQAWLVIRDEGRKCLFKNSQICCFAHSIR
jgi:hypothetical protein